MRRVMPTGNIHGVRVLGTKRPIKPKATKTTYPGQGGGRLGKVQGKASSGFSAKMNKKGILD